MEKSKFVKTEQPEANIMERLPQEMILRILSRLPVTSLVQSMLVCRAWRSLIQDPLLVSNHFSNMADKGPSFIFQTNQPSSPYQLFFIDFADIHSDGKVVFKKLPNSSMSMYLVDSCNGLLCMRVSQEIHIYNPFTRVSLELPKLDSFSRVGHIAFGFDRTTNKYKVVRIVFRRLFIGSGSLVDVAASSIKQSEVHVITIGDPAWRKIGTLPYYLTRQTPKALVNGRIHWFPKPYRNTTASLLISFDLATEQFEEIPKPDCCGLDRCFHHLMVLGGCLSVGAYHDNEQLEIWVMKEYGIKESWIKQFNIATNYLPKTLQLNDLQRVNIARARLAGFRNWSVRPLCILKNGEILLHYRNRVIVLYDPQHGTFMEFTFPEMPSWYKFVVQVGSLNWIDTPINV
ncbi:hypothetical protein PTKIN_Ptkin12aG0066900 [Pterospermum kingtungense]